MYYFVPSRCISRVSSHSSSTLHCISLLPRLSFIFNFSLTPSLFYHHFFLFYLIIVIHWKKLWFGVLNLKQLKTFDTFNFICQITRLLYSLPKSFRITIITKRIFQDPFLSIRSQFLPPISPICYIFYYTAFYADFWPRLDQPWWMLDKSLMSIDQNREN